MGLGRQQVQNIPQEFKMLIDGNTWTYSEDFSVPAASSVDFLIKTGNVDTVISIAQADVFGAETAFYGFLNSTISDNGTEVFAVNHNGNYTGNSTTRMFKTPTITSDGTQASIAVAYAANQPGKIALADAQILSKYILKRNSNNIMRVTNRDATNATKVSLVLDYVEVDIT